MSGGVPKRILITQTQRNTPSKAGNPVPKRAIILCNGARSRRAMCNYIQRRAEPIEQLQKTSYTTVPLFVGMEPVPLYSSLKITMLFNEDMAPIPTVGLDEWLSNITLKQFDTEGAFADFGPINLKDMKTSGSNVVVVQEAFDGSVDLKAYTITWTEVAGIYPVSYSAHLDWYFRVTIKNNAATQRVKNIAGNEIVPDSFQDVYFA